jgi:hypothetical protein
VIISPDGEGEATLNFGVVGLQVGITQRTARQHRLLCLVEGNRTELLPVADELILHYDLVNCELTLYNWSTAIRQARFLPILTSRNDSIGT